jgi:putative peptidoglycan lipid II flippase
MWYGYVKMYSAPKLTFFRLNPGIFKMFKLMCAGMYGASVAQIGMGIDSIILSMLAAGSISWVYYAERLSYLPLGVFGVSIATVLSPSLARSSQAGQKEVFQKQVAWGVVSAGMIGIPAAIGLSLLAEPVVTTLFYRGKFSLEDVQQTAAALQIFSLGIPAYMWIKVFAGAFYARQETWIPVQCATAALGVNILVACVGSYWYAHIGIAYAVAVSAYTNAGLLYWRLHRQGVFQFKVGDLEKLAKVSCASAFVLVGVWVVPSMQYWLHLGMLHQVTYLSAALMISLLGYGGVLWALALDWRSPEY